ncbi:ATP-grasp domain-containing protein [Neoactinobaculum massilliense]|mgnify:CR=1 FL=1|uniref:ATP-grasp domain-containing protein n=1 Tax=Neoactinobaculum massilliense TaxID=2364794 RepID=UPI000F5320C7|nr:glutathione synthetase [Neoactinobaculum massilliense]
MADPIVTLVTSADFPNLTEDEAGLPDALRQRGIEPRVAVWNDPDVDWNASDLTVIRSARDYARHVNKFRKWAASVPRLLNQPELVEWNSDKHYLRELAAHGLPTIPTTWLEPEAHYSKHQVHTRFPADGDFVVKPAVSSGGRGTGRYTATDATSRSEAILHAQHELRHGRSVMVQRYLDAIDQTGEVSLVFLNGIVSYRVEKQAMLHPRYRNENEVKVENVLNNRPPSEHELVWAERVRQVLHEVIRERTGRDHLMLFDRVDLVPAAKDDPNEFYLMEISLIDSSLYLSADPQNLEKFADAIAVRASW